MARCREKRDSYSARDFDRSTAHHADDDDDDDDGEELYYLPTDFLSVFETMLQRDNLEKIDNFF